MKLIILFFITIFYNYSYAFEQEMDVVVRNDHFRAEIKKEILTDLNTSYSFDGKYFKIVLKKSNTPINFGDSQIDKKTLLRAATTYFHLTKARNFFVNVLGSDYVNKMGPITIRLEITNEFHTLGHFTNDAFKPQYNNALSIPSSPGYPERNILPWNMEIWFRPQKKININELNTRAQYDNFHQIIRQFRNEVHMTNFQRFLSQTIIGQVNNLNFDITSLIRTAGTALLLETVYLGQKPIEKIFSRKNFWLDSALVPEIIYHEFSHIALSDHLELTHSTAVIEGMADYFAGKIANSKKLATKISRYNTFSGKKVRTKDQYKTEFDMNKMANADFVFGLLWNTGLIVGKEFENNFIYELRSKITTNSSIRSELLQGILDTCDENCSQPVTDRIKLLKLFNEKGI